MPLGYAGLTWSSNLGKSGIGSSGLSGSPTFGLADIQHDPMTVGIYQPQIWGGSDQLVRRNLLIYTEEFSNAAWSKTKSGAGSLPVITSKYGTDPFGVPNNADRIILATNGTAVADISNVHQSATFNCINPISSFYVKSNTSDCTIILADTIGEYACNVTTSWKRISISSVGTSVITRIRLRGNVSSTYADLLVFGAMVCGSDIHDKSYQKITDWTTEVYAYNAARQLPWLRRNRFVSTATLATQTVSSVTASQLTVSFTGTGTITFSGAYSGSLVGTGASDRVQTTFTPTAGNLTCTVSGSVTLAQCENAAAATAYQAIGADWPSTYTALAIAAGYPISLYSDRAGTIAVDSPDTVVGKMLDLSTKGNHLVAPTDAARPLLKRDGNGNFYLLRDLVDDALNVTLPNYGANCVTYQQDAAACNKATGVTLNGATSFSTPAIDYGRVLLQGPSNNDAKIQRYLNKLAGL